MLNNEAVIRFVEPYYADKDIMHNMWHIELVLKSVEHILTLGQYEVDKESLTLAAYFHGFIYAAEPQVRRWMSERGYSAGTIDKTVLIAWESQRSEVPETLEGKILHDAHVLEGGKSYLAVKTLITGSVRGQTLCETLDYMEKHVLDKNVCYLPETIPLCEEMNHYASQLFCDLIKGIE